MGDVFFYLGDDLGWGAVPASFLYLKPFQLAGLWLAVMIIAPPVFWARTP